MKWVPPVGEQKKTLAKYPPLVSGLSSGNLQNGAKKPLRFGARGELCSEKHRDKPTFLPQQFSDFTQAITMLSKNIPLHTEIWEPAKWSKKTPPYNLGSRELVFGKNKKYNKKEHLTKKHK